MGALDGKPIANIHLADIGSASGFGGKSSDPDTFYAFSSYARPTTIYRFDTQTGESEIFAEPKLTFKPADFPVEQRRSEEHTTELESLIRISYRVSCSPTKHTIPVSPEPQQRRRLLTQAT